MNYDIVKYKSYCPLLLSPSLFQPNPTQLAPPVLRMHFQELQKEMKKAQKEAAKAAKKDSTSTTKTMSTTSASPASSSRDTSGSVAASNVGKAAKAGAVVHFCAASPPTVAYAACALARVKMDFVVGEVRVAA